MASYERFYDPKILARVGRLELRAKMIVEGIITGMHKSPYHGQSVEFVDHRAYVPGDDPRHIDWKVLGRSDRIVLKRFEEETNLRGHLLLDSSESMRYGSPGRRDIAGEDSGRRRGAAPWTKYEYGGTLAASIAYLLQRQHDAVGLTLFDSQVRARIPPRLRSARASAGPAEMPPRVRALENPRRPQGKVPGPCSGARGARAKRSPRVYDSSCMPACRSPSMMRNW